MKYEITYKDGTKEVVETNKKNVVGILGFKNEGEWSYSLTSSKNVRKVLDSQKNMPGRDWLSEWHLTEFKEI